MRFLLSCALAFAAVLSSAAGQDAISEAVAAMQRGDLLSAERNLQQQLRMAPKDADALDLLAVVLDQQKKYAEADNVYRRAIAVSPSSPALLNNFGNHLVATGKLAEAREVFLEVLALNPGQANATVQLAQIALKQKSPAEAMKYLDGLSSGTQQAPEVSILRMQADYELGHRAEAKTILTRLSHLTDSDAHLNFSLGVALSSARQYAEAEAFFNRAVEAAPGNFEALYDLGLAASHAGHNERAREALQQALQQQPNNVDVLYDLAVVNAALNEKAVALELLVKAAGLAPQRPDVQLLIAHTSSDLGYFGDAVQAWSRYMKLAPGDDAGRREHAFAQIALGENVNSAMSDLEWFVRRHPNDPAGHYELGTAQGPLNADEALKELDRALALEPDLVPAHMARGILNYRRGEPAAALPDFQFAAEHEPENPAILNHLGQTYMALGNFREAAKILHKAADLAPRDSTVLLHLGRALTNTGQTDEAKAVFARLRELGPNRSALPHPAGLVEFLSLSPDEQFDRYRAGVLRTVQQNPDNAEAQVRYLELLLAQGESNEAEPVAKKILVLRPSAVLLADAARALLGAEKYSLANDFLQQALPLAGDSSELRLDMAIATFHIGDSQLALTEIDGIPQSARNGDYYLARFLIVDALGRDQDASTAFEQALEAKPTRPDLYRQAALLLFKKMRTAEALRLLDQGCRILPNDPDLALLRTSAKGS